MSAIRRNYSPAVICLALVGLLLVLALYHWPVRQASATSAALALPTLQGAAATEYLKQQGLSASLNEALTATRYGLKHVPEAQRGPSGSEYVADNPAQQWRASFAADGVEFSSTAQSGSAWQMGMKLRSLGYGAQQSKVGAGTLSAQGSRIEYERRVAGEQAGNDQSAIRNPQSRNGTSTRRRDWSRALRSPDHQASAARARRCGWR